MQQIRQVITSNPDSLGVWQHSMIFSEVRTAKEWHMTPSEFAALSREDKAMMVAHDRMSNLMDAYIGYLSKPKETKGKH